jgi:hypothetical protein
MPGFLRRSFDRLWMGEGLGFLRPFVRFSAPLFALPQRFFTGAHV